MELNLQENVKEKIVAPMQGGLVEHAQKKVPVVSKILCSFLQLFSYITVLRQHNEHRIGNLLFISCFFVTEVGINQDSGGQFRDIINAYLEPKCHSPYSEAVQRLAFIFPTLLND